MRDKVKMVKGLIKLLKTKKSMKESVEGFIEKVGEGEAFIAESIGFGVLRRTSYEDVKKCSEFIASFLKSFERNVNLESIFSVTIGGMSGYRNYIAVGDSQKDQNIEYAVIYERGSFDDGALLVHRKGTRQYGIIIKKIETNIKKPLFDKEIREKIGELSRWPSYY